MQKDSSQGGEERRGGEGGGEEKGERRREASGHTQDGSEEWTLRVSTEGTWNVQSGQEAARPGQISMARPQLQAPAQPDQRGNEEGAAGNTELTGSLGSATLGSCWACWVCRA